jgi:hypothetical protein
MLVLMKNLPALPRLASTNGKQNFNEFEGWEPLCHVCHVF